MRHCLFVFFTWLVFLIPIVSADSIFIAADRWCPFNCAPNKGRPGMMLEVAQRVFSEHGHQVKYVEMNWPRAIQEARKGNVDAIVGGFKSDAPDFIYPQEELAVIGNAFFVRKDSDWFFNGVESLKAVQLGAVLGYDYGDELRDYIQKSSADSVTMLSGAYHPLSHGIKLLHRHRIDTFIEVGPVFWFNATQLGLANHFKFAGEVDQPEKAYIAFSPALKNSTLYAKQLTEGIRKLRTSGELSKILAKYDLADWKK